ncbi:helix-turn-helix domain-containing protein [Microbacterium oleivorans]|uniref:Helix-turn-helix transcriptional regulator n=1 Tax=Microbacterium oleivorans TaxID=273677 RepID=A0A7D5IY02_9MICO|nr:helix-turn-helix transcriptional regulator [Microbacterium oleivorans]
MADSLLSARVARSVRAILAEKRLTQEWLAEASGIPMRTLARRLHVRRPSPLSIEELATIAVALGVGMGDLLPGFEHPRPQEERAARTPPPAGGAGSPDPADVIDSDHGSLEMKDSASTVLRRPESRPSGLPPT